MATYIARRIVQLIPVLVGITLVTFVLVRLTGDPAAIMLPPDTPEEVVQEFRREFGLDQPLHIQYLRFIGRALHGDFGDSIRYKEPVLKLFLERLPATLELAITSMILAISIGVPVGSMDRRTSSHVDRLMVSVF